MSEQRNYRPGRTWRVWGVILVGLLMVVSALWEIKTLLGVEALTIIAYDEDNNPVYDKVGREFIWRIWWRSRDEFLEVDPQWVLTAGLGVMLVGFCAGLLAMVWIALSPEPDSDPAAE